MSEDRTEVLQNADHELRKLEIKAGVKKVVYGTMIVGVAAAFFPFAQHSAAEVASYMTSSKIEARTAQEGRRVFLESLAAEGRDPKLSVRIILAEYYAHLAEEPDRTQWKKLLERLEAQQRDLWKAETARDVTAANPASTPEEIARTSAAAKQMRGSADPGPNGGAALPSNFEDYLSLLSSEDSAVRRRARRDLAEIGLPLVRPAMSYLTEPDIAYRPRLGLIVALTLFMREHKHQRAAIMDLLTPNDLRNLLTASVDSDRTLRIHAAEFLYDLGDARTFDLIDEVWASTSSSDGRFNLALAMKGAAPYARGEQVTLARVLMRDRLGKVGAKTDRLLTEGMEKLLQ